MQDKYFSVIKNWFHHYVHSFYSQDEELHFHVRLKEDHTLRVVKIAGDLAKWLKFSTEQVELAEIIALLHDIGRFTQYQTYRTFNDALSANHGELGLEVLQQSQILSLSGLPIKEQGIVTKAVLYHNRRHLPIDIAEDCSVFAKLIRDADKLDIFAMLVTDNKDNKIPRPPEVKDATSYSAQIVEDIFQGKLVEHAAIKTAADLMLFRLSWLYDIYFSYSFACIVKEQYVEQLVATLPDTGDIQRVHCWLQEYAIKHSEGTNLM
jgi:putative nucleotidyltransferase with HDIG domain